MILTVNCVKLTIICQLSTNGYAVITAYLKFDKKYLIFVPRQRENCNLYPPSSVANVHLERSFCVKYLGVHIDCHLTWCD